MAIEDLVREVHDTHHPIAVGRYYEDQREAALQRAGDFRDNRLPVFLRFFEQRIAANDSGWLVGDHLSYCDLALFQTIAGLKYAFPNTLAGLAEDLPGVLRVATSVANDQRLVDYLATRPPFNDDGIFRHYPELDKPQH